MKIEKLEDKWMELFSSANNSTTVKEGFKRLVASYSEKHRHYHKLSHVNACLKHLDEVSDRIENFFNVEAAIWFHDVIYNPKKNDNEEMSAKNAKAFLKSIALDSELIEDIGNLILITKHPSNPSKNDEKYLVDIDLSILAADEEIYDIYELSIKKEYAFVPSFIYKRERKKILNSFMKSDRIYRTEYFYKKYESRARQNIDRSMQ